VPSLQTEDLARAETAEHCELPDETLAQTELRKAHEDFFAGHDATWVRMRPPRREERSGGVAVDEPVRDSHRKDGSQIETEMIDDARTERLGLAVEQLLKSARSSLSIG
jgi:hypothetical protein